jgi:hypothetical protein
MTLKDFESQIDSKIQQRGKEYFQDGNVEFIEEMKKNIWAADVIGTDDYQIEIQLGSKGEIKKHKCNCPYDYGAICKHVVAVLYAIIEQKTINITSQKTTNSKKVTFDKMLQMITLQEYQDFIKHYSVINKNFKDEFELYFAEKNPSFNVEKKYSVLIKKTIRSHTSRGFIDYHASNKLGKELQKYVDSSDQFFSKKNYRDAFVLCKVLIREICPVFDYCDDSNGYVAECADQAIDSLSELTRVNVSIEFKEQIAKFIKEELQNSIYFNYGNFGYNLTAQYADISIAIHKTNDFMEFINDKIERSKNNDYDKKFFIQQKILFLKEIGQEEQAQQLVQQNLEVSEIRTIEINRLIEQKEYGQAKILLAEGIKIAEKKNHSGTVAQWERELLRIAVLENDIVLIRFFSKKFAIYNGLSLPYYNQWKNTFSTEEWKEIIEKEIDAIIDKVNQASKKYVLYDFRRLNSTLLYNLAPIYVQENYLDRLFELVQKEQNLDNILTYFSNLKNQYSIEIIELLVPLFEKQGEHSEGRSQYKYLSQKMQFIINDLPESKEKILAVAQKLKAKYPRRPAMIEELEKLF